MPKKEQKQKPEQIDRRKLLASLGAGALTVLVPHNQSKWDFLFDNKSRDVNPPESKINNDYVEVSRHELSEADLLTLPWLEKTVLGDMGRRGYVPGKFVIEGPLIDYAVPEDFFSGQLKEYCESAQKFLNSRIKGINSQVEWIAPKKGDDLGNLVRKGIVCDSRMICIEAKIMNPSDRKLLFESKYGEVRKGGCVSSNVDNNTSYLFVSTGHSAIMSPFSEMIAMATTEKIRNRSTQNLAEATIINEALHDGISTVLSSEFARIKKIPRAQEMIEKNLKDNISLSLYAYLPKSIAWIQRNGVQNAYDLYMRDPQKYLDAIRK
jgi:hypothetical protein